MKNMHYIYLQSCQHSWFFHTSISIFFLTQTHFKQESLCCQFCSLLGNLMSEKLNRKLIKTVDICLAVFVKGYYAGKFSLVLLIGIYLLLIKRVVPSF